VTLLVFFAATAGAGVVAAGLGRRVGRSVPVAPAIIAHHLQIFHLFFMLALNVARHALHGALRDAALLFLKGLGPLRQQTFGLRLLRLFVRK
jgi:hypothetical protein